MDFLNKASTQFVDLFKSMTPGARITAGLLLVMVVTSMAFLVNHAGSGEGPFLMGGESFAAGQIPAMLAAFDKANLHDAQVEGSRIRVPFGKESQYMGALADGNALPATFGSYLEKAIKTNPFASREEKSNAVKIAKQQELQLVIRNMQGIENAAVMYDEEHGHGLVRSKTSTASVSVKPLGNLPLDENQARMIRHLVAGAWAGLKPESVTITDLNGRIYPGTSASGGLGTGMDDPFASRKKLYEKEWADKIAGVLAYIPGVLVASNVELDPETSHEESHTDFDPKTVPYNQRETTNSKLMRGPAASGGRPGFAAQQNGPNQPAAVGLAAGPENTEENNQNETQSAVSNKRRVWTTAGLTPKRVTVTVGIPSSYYEKIWSERNSVPAGQELKKPDADAVAAIETEVKNNVQNSVVGLLPSPGATVDPFPRVTVTTFPHLSSVALPAPGIPDKALAWAGQYWSTLGLLGLGLVSLVMLRSMVRAVPVAASAPRVDFDAVSAATADSEAAAEASADAEALTARSRLKRRSTTGPSLRDELSELIKEDPDSAVSVLRAWIGNAS